MYTKDFYYFVSILTNANVNEDRLRQMKVDYFTVFSFFQSNLCFKILNYNFLLSQLQITVLLNHLKFDLSPVHHLKISSIIHVAGG